MPMHVSFFTDHCTTPHHHCISINASREFVFSAAINICWIDNYIGTSPVFRWPDASSILIQRRPRCFWFLCFYNVDWRITMIHIYIYTVYIKCKRQFFVSQIQTSLFTGIVREWHCLFVLDWIQLLETKTCYSETTLFRMHPRSWWKMLEPRSNGDLEGIHKWA